METLILLTFSRPEPHPAGLIRACALLLDAGWTPVFHPADFARLQPLLENEFGPFVNPVPDQTDHLPRLSALADGTWQWTMPGSEPIQAPSAPACVQAWLQPSRTATVYRKTAETEIRVSVNLDGTGKSTITTGLGFFDHMLEQIARHGLIDLEIACNGDLHIDEHHTIEDTALALGDCLSQAIGDKKGIERYSWALPMDEALALVSIDLSGRPYLQFEAAFSREYVGDFPTEMTRHFFYSLAMQLRATLQMNIQAENDHHRIEALFKGFARCLRGAVSRNPRIRNLVPSSKGIL